MNRGGRLNTPRENMNNDELARFYFFFYGIFKDLSSSPS